MKTKRYCKGCNDDFYNNVDMGLNMVNGVPQCLKLAAAKMVKAYDIPNTMRPPYKGLTLTSRPDCHRRKGFSRVEKACLDIYGFWRK